MPERRLVELTPEELENKLKERTLVLCKPESIVLGVYPYILERVQRMRYKTPLIKMFKFTKGSVLEFYAPVIDAWKPRKKMEKTFLKMTEDPSLAVVVEGPNSINAMRKLAGGAPRYTKKGDEIELEGYKAQFQPSMAPIGTIRGDFAGMDKYISDTKLFPVPNFMHASTDKDEYEREVGVLLKHRHVLPEDFIEYERPDWKVLYRVDV